MRRHLANPDLPAESRRQLIGLLNDTLASALDLSLQAKHAHWNVRGPEFVSIHKLFDDVADRLRHSADVIAERATALGGTAEGTARLVGKNSHVTEYELDAVTTREHIAALAERMSLYARDLEGGGAHGSPTGRPRHRGCLHRATARPRDGHLVLGCFFSARAGEGARGS